MIVINVIIGLRDITNHKHNLTNRQNPNNYYPTTIADRFDRKGTKIGKSAAIIPIEYTGEFIKILKKYEVEYKLFDVYMN